MKWFLVTSLFLVALSPISIGEGLNAENRLLEEYRDALRRSEPLSRLPERTPEQAVAYSAQSLECYRAERAVLESSPDPRLKNELWRAMIVVAQEEAARPLP